jgi:hypothetical protein
MIEEGDEDGLGVCMKGDSSGRGAIWAPSDVLVFLKGDSFLCFLKVESAR